MSYKLVKLIYAEARNRITVGNSQHRREVDQLFRCILEAGKSDALYFAEG